MAKFTPTTVASGFNSATTIDTNFDNIATELNTKVLYRNNPVGEPNTMENDLDMNSNDILNTASVSTDVLNIAGTKVSVTAFSGTNIAKFYTTVANMKAATDLELGDLAVTQGYTAAGDGGHGVYRIVAAATGTDDGGLYHDLTGITGQAELLLQNVINAEQFGADNTDSTTELQAAANAAVSTGLPFTFGYNSRKLATDEITFSGKVDIIGGLLKNAPGAGNENNPAIWIQGDESSIDNVDIEGEDIAGTYPVLAFSNSGIRVGPATAPGFVTNINIGSNIKISQMKGEGILLDHVKEFTVGSPHISECGYAGILAQSCVDGTIANPVIETIQDEAVFVNHYGITLTRPNTTNLTDDPQTTNIQVGQPVIRDVINWIGLDVHAGININVDYARCYNCKIPFNIQYDSTDVGVRNQSKNITLRGYGEGFSTEAATGMGCSILGIDNDERAENIDIDLHLKTCGDATDAAKGALTISNAKDVRGRVLLVDSYRAGMSLVGTNDSIRLDVEQRGVDWTGGSAFYCYVDADTQTNNRITGSWKAGNIPAATIGIFYTAAETSAYDMWFDKVRMVLDTGTSFISDGVTPNQYGDLSWTVETERASFTGSISGGVQFDETLGDRASEFRRVPTDYLGLSPNWSLYNQNSNSDDHDIRSFANNTSPAVFRIDGSNTIAQTVSVNCEQSGLFFVD